MSDIAQGFRNADGVMDVMVGLGVSRDRIFVCDSKGVLYQGRPGGMDESKQRYAQVTDKRTLADAVKAQLNANLGTARLADLSSQMYLAAGEGFTMSFANIPAGTYEYNCTPHLAMGMKGKITVQ